MLLVCLPLSPTLALDTVLPVTWLPAPIPTPGVLGLGALVPMLALDTAFPVTWLLVPTPTPGVLALGALVPTLALDTVLPVTWLPAPGAFGLGALKSMSMMPLLGWALGLALLLAGGRAALSWACLPVLPMLALDTALPVTWLPAPGAFGLGALKSMSMMPLLDWALGLALLLAGGRAALSWACLPVLPTLALDTVLPVTWLPVPTPTPDVLGLGELVSTSMIPLAFRLAGGRAALSWPCLPVLPTLALDTVLPVTWLPAPGAFGLGA